MLLALAVLGLLLLRLERAADLPAAIRKAGDRPAWLLAAFGFFGLCLLFGFARWTVLSNALGLKLQRRAGLRLYALGHAINLVTPGATGGDFYKAAAFAFDRPGQRSTAVFSVFVDRLSGLFWLLVLVVGTATVRRQAYGNIPGGGLLVGLCAGGLAAAVLGATVLRLWPAGQAPGIAARGGAKRSALGKALREIVRAAPFLWRPPRVFWETALLSLGNHVGQAACAWAVARSLGIGLSWGEAIATFPMVTLLASIPLTPGGLGVREAANQWLLAEWSVGGAEAMAVGLIVYGVMLVWAFVGLGGWYAAGFRRPGGRPGGGPVPESRDPARRGSAAWFRGKLPGA